MKEENKTISRKDFLKGVGTSLAGVAVMGTLGSTLTGCTDSGSADTGEAAPYPYKYTKLDPAVGEEMAYNTYFEQGG